MSNSLTAEIRAALTPGPGTVVITAGNPWRRDDGVGPYISERLRGVPGLAVIAAGQNPENIVDEVLALRPARVLVIDAADFGGRPGELRLLAAEQIPSCTLSTHMIPLNVITALIQDETGAAATFLGIQVATVTPGEGLSPPVQQAAEQVLAAVGTAF